MPEPTLSSNLEPLVYISKILVNDLMFYKDAVAECERCRVGTLLVQKLGNKVESLHYFCLLFTWPTFAIFKFAMPLISINT